jgi:hypothetical protein
MCVAPGVHVVAFVPVLALVSSGFDGIKGLPGSGTST